MASFVIVIVLFTPDLPLFKWPSVFAGIDVYVRNRPDASGEQEARQSKVKASKCTKMSQNKANIHQVSKTKYAEVMNRWAELRARAVHYAQSPC